MNDFKHFLFKIILFGFSKLPFKNFLTFILIYFGISNHKIYKDLKFSGIFNVTFKQGDKNYQFKLYHFRGYIENETFWKGSFTTFDRESGKNWMGFSKVSNVIFDMGQTKGFIHSYLNQLIKIQNLCFMKLKYILTIKYNIKEIEHFNINYLTFIL